MRARPSSTPRWITWGLSALVAGLSGCIAFTPMPDETASVGVTHRGLLRRGEALDDRGPGFVRARPGESTRFGTPALLAAVRRAAAEVARAFPGSQPMWVGDVSGPSGGRHPRHQSHRTGRDVDLLFYATDLRGRPVPGRGWLAYNRFGLALDRSETERGRWVAFDDARNWHFVRTLLLDPEAGAQWLFVSRGVKARLLRYADAHESDPRAIFRAAYVLHQPSRAAPHDDHFHLRVMCAPRELALGCRNRAPYWPWLDADFEKAPREVVQPLDDAALVRALLGPRAEPVEIPVDATDP